MTTRPLGSRQLEALIEAAGYATTTQLGINVRTSRSLAARGYLRDLSDGNEVLWTITPEGVAYLNEHGLGEHVSEWHVPAVRKLHIRRADSAYVFEVLGHGISDNGVWLLGKDAHISSAVFRSADELASDNWIACEPDGSNQPAPAASIAERVAAVRTKIASAGANLDGFARVFLDETPVETRPLHMRTENSAMTLRVLGSASGGLWMALAGETAHPIFRHAHELDEDGWFACDADGNAQIPEGFDAQLVDNRGTLYRIDRVCTDGAVQLEWVTSAGLIGRGSWLQSELNERFSAYPPQEAEPLPEGFPVRVAGVWFVPQIRHDVGGALFMVGRAHEEGHGVWLWREDDGKLTGQFWLMRDMMRQFTAVCPCGLPQAEGCAVWHVGRGSDPVPPDVISLGEYLASVGARLLAAGR